MFNQMSYYDYYSFASAQKTSLNYEIIGLYLIMLYSLKFLEIFEIVNVVLIAFKKAYFEFLILSIIITVIFLCLSYLTNFIYGVYIYEYSTVAKSIMMNFKIFILSERADVAEIFLDNFKAVSVFVMIVFIFLFRYFLLNLYFPIFCEYLRIEYDNYIYNIIKDEKENKVFTLKDSNKINDLS